jgi:hypothetical protein
MGFFTELFSRPRPQDMGRIRASRALIDAIGGNTRIATGIRPADFPRMARELGRR